MLGYILTLDFNIRKRWTFCSSVDSPFTYTSAIKTPGFPGSDSKGSSAMEGHKTSGTVFTKNDLFGIELIWKIVHSVRRRCSLWFLMSKKSAFHVRITRSVKLSSISWNQAVIDQKPSDRDAPTDRLFAIHTCFGHIKQFACFSRFAAKIAIRSSWMNSGATYFHRTNIVVVQPVGRIEL